MGVVKLQFSPRTATVETDTPDVLAHALAKLRRCGDDAINVLRLTDELPEVVLPYLAWTASRRRDVPARSVRILMKCCGELLLERTLGRHRLRMLKARYPISEPFASL
ncbi:hypothetical protein ABIB90_002742 [Bradyrhizobium sp. JR4.1]